MKTKTKARILSGLMAVSVLAPATPFALSVASCKEVPETAANSSVVLYGKTVTVDYSGSGLTQAQANVINPGLTEVAGVISAAQSQQTRWTLITGRPNFKIIIVPGLNGSGCARVGDNMTLGADFLLNNDADGIGEEISIKAMSTIFAMLITPSYIARANSGNQRLS